MTIAIIPIKLPNAIKKHQNLIDFILGQKSTPSIKDDDILVFTQKIISKQEGRKIELAKVRPTLLATGIGSAYGKDPRIIQLILDETKRIVRMKNGIMITETKHGFICANAGVDESNIENGFATLLPKNPQKTAKKLQMDIKCKTGKNTAVIISDTFGRPFREGQVDVAIGFSGISPIIDYAGSRDTFGRVLRVTAISIVDELCSASELVRGKSLGIPVTIVRNYKIKLKDANLNLLRSKSNDLFR